MTFHRFLTINDLNNAIMTTIELKGETLLTTGLITMQGQKKIAMIAHDNKKPHCLNGPATIELHHFVAANGRLI